MRVLSRICRAAVVLLGRQVKIGRQSRGWSQRELAERAGIARATLQKIEGGDPGCAIGVVFEVATLVGIPLYGSDEEDLDACVRE